MSTHGWTDTPKRQGNSEASEQETAEMVNEERTPVERTPADGVGPTPEARANMDHVPDAEKDGGILGFFKKLFS